MYYHAKKQTLAVAKDAQKKNASKNISQAWNLNKFTLKSMKLID